MEQKSGMAPPPPEINENLVTFSFCVFLYFLWKFKQKRETNKATEDKKEIASVGIVQPNHFLLTDCFGDVIVPPYTVQAQDEYPIRSSTPFSISSGVSECESERDKWEVVSETAPLLLEHQIESDME